MPDVVALVAAADAERGAVRRALDALRGQRPEAPAIVLVEPGPGAGAAFAEAVLATTAPLLLLLSAPVGLRDDAIARGRARLDDGAADFVWFSGGPVPVPDLMQALARPPRAALLRRRAVHAGGAFAADAAGDEGRAFWAALLERGFTGTVLLDALVPGPPRADVLAAGDRAARAAVLGGRAGALLPDVAASVTAFEAVRTAEQGRARGLSVAIAEGERRSAGLRAEAATLAAALREAGEEPLDWGDLRRLEPFSPTWGTDRGRPVDRHYIEEFLSGHRADVRGAVLEVFDSGYTRSYGGDRVTRAEAVDVNVLNPRATVYADLTRADSLASDAYDCFILTQTVHIIYDVEAVIAEAHRVLKPGGVLLCTLPAVSRVSYEDGGLDGGDHWRFTADSLWRLFGARFPAASLEIESHGSAMTCAAFLMGLAVHELDPAELLRSDPAVPLCFTVRAVKAAAPATRARGGGRGAVLLYHRAPPAFREHLDLLAARRPVLPLEELLDHAAAGTLPEGAVALTFDDATRDALDVVSPALAASGLPGTFFATSVGLDAPAEHWWDVLDAAFQDDGPWPDEIDLGPLGRWTTADAAGRAAAKAALHGRFVWATRSDRARATALLLAAGKAPPPREPRRALTAEELRALDGRPGHRVGAHGAEHLLLPAQSAADERVEVEANRRRLEEVLGRTVDVFAYPYGGFHRRTIDTVAACGIRRALTTERGLVGPGTDPLLVPRVEVGDVGAARLEETLLRAFGGPA